MSSVNTAPMWDPISHQGVFEQASGNIQTDAQTGTQYTLKSSSFAQAILSIPSQARVTYTSGPINVQQFIELAIDFNITAVTGGVAPTITFLVSRINLDNILYPLEQLTALSVFPGKLSYHLGEGLDNKSFGNLVQIDMVTTGGPTSVTFSGGVIGK